MTDFKAYLIRLTAAAILASVVQRLAPSGGAGRAARLGAGFLVLLTAFAPIVSINTAEAAEHLAIQGYSDPLNTEDFASATNTLLTELITEEAEAYILDKAQALSLDITAEVTAQIQDTYPVPWTVTIRGSPTAAQKAALTENIAEELGIPEERQEWLNM